MIHQQNRAAIFLNLIKCTIVILFLAWALSGCSTEGRIIHQQNKMLRMMKRDKVILKWHTDKHGFTSVVWKDNNGKEWALDYATRQELKSEGLIKP